MKHSFIPPLLVFLSVLGGSDAQSPAPADQTCAGYTFSGDTAFKACVDLPVLSSYLHWTYNAAAATVDMAYRRTGVAAPGQWVSWAINPSSGGMVGAQCLVAVVGPDGEVTAYTSPVTSYSTGLSKGQLSFDVSRLKAVYADEEVSLFATLEVPKNKTKVNYVWQDGPLSARGVPLSHVTDGPNMRSIGTLDLLAEADQQVEGNGVGEEERLNNTSNIDDIYNNNNNSGFKLLGVWDFPLCVTLICTIISGLLLLDLA